MTGYVYFVAYNGKGHGTAGWAVGNTEITSATPITHQPQIREIERAIQSREPTLASVVLTGYQLMRED